MFLDLMLRCRVAALLNPKREACGYKRLEGKSASRTARSGNKTANTDANPGILRCCGKALNVLHTLARGNAGDGDYQRYAETWV